MGFDELLSKADILIQHMREDGHSECYIRQVTTELSWLKKNGDSFGSYESACIAREAQTASSEMKRRYRLMYGILKRFDVDGVFPDFRLKDPLFKRGAYHQLRQEFKDVIDRFAADGRERGLKEKTVKGYSSAGSLFLLAMQKRGKGSLGEITEDDVLSFFTGQSGEPAISSGFEKEIVSVLESNLGDLSCDGRRLEAFVPRIRPKCKNVQYLQPEEVEAVRGAMEDERAPLSLRDRAIGSLLLFAGLRPCDIAGLTLDDISWERDEIRIVQEKTGSPLLLPLTVPIGNAIFDYLAEGRPESSDPHVFLGLLRPHDPLTASSVWHVAGRLYDAAGIRPPGIAPPLISSTNS